MRQFNVCFNSLKLLRAVDSDKRKLQQRKLKRNWRRSKAEKGKGLTFVSTTTLTGSKNLFSPSTGHLTHIDCLLKLTCVYSSHSLAGCYVYVLMFTEAKKKRKEKTDASILRLAVTPPGKTVIYDTELSDLTRAGLQIYDELKGPLSLACKPNGLQKVFWLLCEL